MISGDNSLRDPPVPIPNTEVKPQHADSTWLETAREGRSSPDSNEGHIMRCVLFPYKRNSPQRQKQIGRHPARFAPDRNVMGFLSERDRGNLSFPKNSFRTPFPKTPLNAKSKSGRHPARFALSRNEWVFFRRGIGGTLSFSEKKGFPRRYRRPSTGYTPLACSSARAATTWGRSCL